MKCKILKTVIYLVADIIIIFGISFLGFLGSYSSELFATSIKWILIYISGLSLLSVFLFFCFKEYKILLSSFGSGDCIRLCFCMVFSNIIGLIFLLTIKELNFGPRNIPILVLSAISIVFLLVFIRILPKLIRIFKNDIRDRNKVNTMIIGAGAAAKIIIDDSKTSPKNNNRVVVLLDDDKLKINTLYSSIPVRGPISNANKLIEEYKIEEVIIAIAELTEERLQEIVGYLAKSNVRVRRMPLLTEMNGPNDSTFFDVDINELLNRKPIKLDNSGVNEMLTGKTILVTGAGGSIGSELTRQIFKAHPSTLVLFDIYENSLYDIQQDLIRKMKRENITSIKLIALIGSTYNEKRVEQIIKKYKPDYVYHAAAYKHVPLMEESPAEAIRTNVIGTYNVAKIANKYNVKKMVLVSTDKAVRPTNTMGATKRFAETIIQYFSQISKNTVFAAVRFGNVLGSNGSVVPLFKKQIEEGGPITITDKNIIRYFMTIPEAVSLILQCGLFADGGEIFILDMGEPVKIYDLAVKLIRCAGLIPNKDINIIETGLRPGEKLFEELLLDKEHQTRTQNDRIFVEQKDSFKPIEDEIHTIAKVFDMDNDVEIKKLLASIIDTYTIVENK